jgi:hypothetical protein
MNTTKWVWWYSQCAGQQSGQEGTWLAAGRMPPVLTKGNLNRSEEKEAVRKQLIGRGGDEVEEEGCGALCGSWYYQEAKSTSVPNW